MDDFISTEEVADLAGVGPTAVKRWADQGLLACSRTPGGHRRFARAEVERFLGRGAQDGFTQILLRDADGREIEARLLTERARRGTWVEAAGLAARALVEIGVRWQAGRLSVLEEHLASERLARVLSRLSGSLPLPPGAPRCLLACAEGDEHTLGLSLAELCLREAGWATLWAGRGTPTDELATLARSGAVRMVALSASSAASDALALRRQAGTLAEACRAGGARLVLGGAGAWPDGPRGARRFHTLGAFAEFARSAAATPTSIA